MGFVLVYLVSTSAFDLSAIRETKEELKASPLPRRWKASRVVTQAQWDSNPRTNDVIFNAFVPKLEPAQGYEPNPPPPFGGYVGECPSSRPTGVKEEA